MGASCLRINPGNIGTKQRVLEVIKAAKNNDCSIRIGVNAGSLDRKLLEKYKEPCPEALVESATYNIKFLEELIDLGFKLESEKVTSQTSKLSGKKIAITGKLSFISRDELKSKLEDLGVKVVNSISKNTDYVIVGSDAGSKLEKARALNIEIISDKNLDTFLAQNEN